MKTFLSCFSVILFVIPSYAQSLSLLNKIAQNINSELANSGLRDQRREITFYKNKENSLSFRGVSDVVDERVASILSQYKDSFQQDETYIASVYFDLYSAKVYSVVVKLRKDIEGSFPNYSTYLGEPSGGASLFNKILYKALKEHIDEVDFPQSSLWYEPIELIIDSGERVPSLIKKHKLQNHLNNILQRPWNPGIINGRPIAIAVKINMGKEIAIVSERATKDHFDRFNLLFMRALMDRFEGNVVKFEEDKKTQDATICVSLVHNPLTSKLEEDVILKGDTNKAKEFIAWLKNLYWSKSKFYATEYSRPSRVFFYLDSAIP